MGDNKIRTTTKSGSFSNDAMGIEQLNEKRETEQNHPDVVTKHTRLNKKQERFG